MDTIHSVHPGHFDPALWPWTVDAAALWHKLALPLKKPKDTSKRIPHPDAESALQAAKKACRGNTGRWFGRAPEGPTAFWVYEGNKVVERHVSSALPIGPPPPIG